MRKSARVLEKKPIAVKRTEGLLMHKNQQITENGIAYTEEISANRKPCQVGKNSRHLLHDFTICVNHLAMNSIGCEQ